jgi:hypothetical protein
VLGIFQIGSIFDPPASAFQMLGLQMCTTTPCKTQISIFSGSQSLCPLLPLFLFAVLGMGPRASPMLGKCCISEPHPGYFFYLNIAFWSPLSVTPLCFFFFFFLVALGLEFGAYTLSHSTSPFLFFVFFFKIGYCKLFAQAAFELRFS